MVALMARRPRRSSTRRTKRICARAERGVEIGMRGGDALGHQALARPCRRCRRSLPARRHALALDGAARAAATFSRHLQIVGRAAAQRVAHARQLGVADDVGHVAVDIVDRDVGADLEGAAIGGFEAGQLVRHARRSRCAWRCPASAARAERGAQHLVEAVVGGIGNHRFAAPGAAPASEPSRRLEQRRVDRLAQQRSRRLVVENGEARRDVGLQREALQQALAERVDGLHLEAAGRLDGDGEQRARAARPRRRAPGGRTVRRSAAPAARPAASPTAPACRTRASTSRRRRPWCR